VAAKVIAVDAMAAVATVVADNMAKIGEGAYSPRQLPSAPQTGSTVLNDGYVLNLRCGAFGCLCQRRSRRGAPVGSAVAAARHGAGGSDVTRPRRGRGRGAGSHDAAVENRARVANLCTDRLRKRRGNVGLDQVEDPADQAPSAVDQMQTSTRMQALSDALAELPERQAQAVSLRHLEGLSNPQIAEIMDISVTSVESLTARGKRALATALASRKQELGYEND